MMRDGVDMGRRDAGQAIGIVLFSKKQGDASGDSLGHFVAVLNHRHRSAAVKPSSMMAPSTSGRSP